MLIKRIVMPDFIKNYSISLLLFSILTAVIIYDVAIDYQNHNQLIEFGKTATATYQGQRAEQGGFKKSTSYSINLKYFNEDQNRYSKALIDVDIDTLKKVRKQYSVKVIYLKQGNNFQVALYDKAKTGVQTDVIWKDFGRRWLILILIFSSLLMLLQWRAHKDAKAFQQKEKGRLDSDPNIPSDNALVEPEFGALYRWRCQACEQSNPANAALCQNCTCPADASAKQIKQHKQNRVHKGK